MILIGFRLIFVMKNSSQCWEWPKMLSISYQSGSRICTKRKSISSRNGFENYRTILNMDLQTKFFFPLHLWGFVCVHIYRPSATYFYGSSCMDHDESIFLVSALPSIRFSVLLLVMWCLPWRVIFFFQSRLQLLLYAPWLRL